MEPIWVIAGGLMLIGSLWLSYSLPALDMNPPNRGLAHITNDDTIYPIYLEMGIAPVEKAQTKHQDVVVLVHGIARTGRSLRPVETCLRRAGYGVVNVTYSSQTKNVGDIVAHLRAGDLDPRFWEDAPKVHFVTHSMGGLVVRRYLERYRDQIPAAKTGRVVMLAPPNGGSEIADLLHRWWPYRWYFGPAGQDLTTAAQRQNIAPPHYELGVIAGTRGWLYLGATLVMPGPHDGRVAVERTKLPGMKDHLTLSATHTFIMNKTATQQQILHFLATGSFRHGAS